VSGSSLTINRFSVTALVAGETREPDRIRARLEQIKPEALGAALAHRLNGLVADGDERVIVLRRLDLGLATGAVADARIAADQVADLLATAIVRLAAAPPEDVAVFANPAAFLAAFVAAVARGEAWDRWWFQRFDGLKFLPASAALRTALLEQPGRGLAAMAALSAADRDAVLQRLEAGDARRLLDAFAATDPRRGAFGAAVAALAWEPPGAWSSTEHASLALVLVAVARGDGAPVGSLARAAAMLCDLRSVSGAEREMVAEALAGGRIRALAERLAPGRVAHLAPLFSATAATRRALAGQLRATATAAITRSHTRFGGLLLLTAHLPDACEGVPALLALAACAGPANAPEAIADPILRDVLGLPAQPSAGELDDWLEGLSGADVGRLASLGAPASRADGRWLATPARLRGLGRVRQAIQGLANAALADFARRLPGFSEASAPFLWRNLLDVPAQVQARGDGLVATLGRPPLDVLLSISGLADRILVLADGRLLTLERSA
jgi:hypothetical protein